MRIEDLKNLKAQVYQIAARHGISKVYVFGSVARGEPAEVSDVDFLVEMEEGASALGIGGFQFEVQQLLGIKIDVIPTFILPNITDRDFVQSIQSEAVAL
jgi:predicted nucleotidyltransferase